MTISKGNNMNYANPILPGFYPDPSICRVDDYFYLVTSSFEYFPGVPIFRSQDLINWEQIGHCLTRDSQLPLHNTHPSHGIFAPSLHYHDGLFYMVTTNCWDKGNFLVTADDPAGEWSEPLWLEQEGVDPSLFWDTDGKVYLQGTGSAEGILQCELDLTTGKMVGEAQYIWLGTGGRSPEGPHMYYRNDQYYLMIAEGGTEYGHREVIARADTIWGPFESCPHNPLVTQADTRCRCVAIQGTGHADLVEDRKGNWWMVCLAFRPLQGIKRKHILGRETYLAPVTWTEDGWPMVYDQAGLYGIDLSMEAELPAAVPVPEVPARDDFDKDELGMQWNFMRNPLPATWTLREQPGVLRLKGVDASLNDVEPCVFIGRRQQHFECSVTVKLETILSSDGNEVGLTVLMNNTHHYEIVVANRNGKRQVEMKQRIGELQVTRASVEIPAGLVYLRIVGETLYYTFYWSLDNESFTKLGQAESRYLSSEVAGGFTGVYFGMYAVGQGSQGDFDWFEYNATTNGSISE
jgi:xylan 1,4-beta-xylosidase